MFSKRDALIEEAAEAKIDSPAELGKLRRLDLLELLLDEVRENEQRTATIQDLTELTERLKGKLDEKDAQAQYLKERLDDKDRTAAHLKDKLDEKDAQIERLKDKLDAKDEQLERLKGKLDDKDARIAEAERRLSAMTDQLEGIHDLDRALAMAGDAVDPAKLVEVQTRAVEAYLEIIAGQQAARPAEGAARS